MHKRSLMLSLGMLVTALNLLAADSHVGTWKMNPAKSSSTNPAMTRTEVWSAQPDGAYKVSRSENLGDGKTLAGTYTFKLDGKEYPVQGNLPFDTISAKRIDANTIEIHVTKKGGQRDNTIRTVISADGKTRTSTVKGKDDAGKQVELTWVYDRQ
jgi:hypothetical protein